MAVNEKKRSVACPRVLIAGLRGSGGKTLVSVGLTAALRRRGLAVRPYKKGADYIDASWLGAAAGVECRNLDLYMVEREALLGSFTETAAGADLAVVEGNRGLYDGMDVRGTYSSAELAKLLRAPVILVCDCTKTTGTIGALVLGCRTLDPQVEIRGVVLNRVAGPRHEAVLRRVIEEVNKLPVLGAVPKLSGSPFAERHLGLLPPQEHGGVPDAVAWVADAAEAHLDLDSIIAIAEAAPELPAALGETESELMTRESRAGGRATGARSKASRRRGKMRVGVLRDEAFQFYYPENLESLQREGAELLFASPLGDASLPDVEALYIGGGFPETLASRLTANEGFRSSVAAAVESGMPVYAECAGAVYLGERLIVDGQSYRMTGSLPVVFGFGSKPQGHGYTAVEVVGSNPFYRTGEIVKGHEFHYSRVLDMDESKISFVFRVRRGFGVDGKRDGMCRKNTLATYCHIHALGVTSWARSLVEAGRSWSRGRKGNSRRSRSRRE